MRLDAIIDEVVVVAVETFSEREALTSSSAKRCKLLNCGAFICWEFICEVHILEASVDLETSDSLTEGTTTEEGGCSGQEVKFSCP